MNRERGHEDGGVNPGRRRACHAAFPRWDVSVPGQFPAIDAVRDSLPASVIPAKARCCPRKFPESGENLLGYGHLQHFPACRTCFPKPPQTRRSREGGNPSVTRRRHRGKRLSIWSAKSFASHAVRLEIHTWMPAFAGMTNIGTILGRLWASAGVTGERRAYHAGYLGGSAFARRVSS